MMTSDLPAQKPIGWCRLIDLLKQYPSSEREVEEMVKAIQTLYPQIPGPFINYPDGPFPAKRPYHVHRTHLIHDEQNLQTAVENIKKAGHSLNSTDVKYLRDVLCFFTGWSATSPEHHNDAWVKYIQHRFSHIENLVPILDDMTWPEEISSLPSEYGPGIPTFMLFANKDDFFVYYYEFDELLRAGSTLEDVYYGLDQSKWLGIAGERWLSEADNGEEYETSYYFPEWKSLTAEGKSGWGLAYPLQDFIPYLDE